MPSEGVIPHGDRRPDLAGRRSFLDRHILIHTHVPKTAGSTLSHAVASIVGGTQSMDLRLKRRIRLRDMSRDDKAALRFLSGHFSHGIHDRFSQKPLYIAALREPVERAISRYRFMQRNPELDRVEDLRGKSFEEAWEMLAEDPNRSRSNDQARILCGLPPATQPEAEHLWRQVDEGYFLLIPMPELETAIQHLRAAYGLPWTKIPRMNPSRGEPPEISQVMRAKVLDENRLDADLYVHVEATFQDRLAKACDYIAADCLAAG